MRTMLRAILPLTAAVMLCTPMTSSQTKPDILLVANQGDHTISVLDAATGRSIKSVATNGNHAHEIAVSPDARTAYLPIYGDSGVGRPGTDGRTIELLDLQSYTITHTIDLGRPVRPHWAGVEADGMLYVSAELSNAVDVIDPGTLKVVASIPTGAPQSHMVVFAHDGKRAYTSNVSKGSVSVLDVTARKVVKVITISDTAQRISISADDQLVFTADQTQPRMAVIDTNALKVSKWIALPSSGFGSTATPDGKWLLVALPQTDQIAVIDLSNSRLVRTVAVPAHPQEILVRQDRPIAYISCNQSGKVAVLNLETWLVEQTFTAGPGADGLALATRR
jgi:YVTN family beta-propeller protein